MDNQTLLIVLLIVLVLVAGGWYGRDAGISWVLAPVSNRSLDRRNGTVGVNCPVIPRYYFSIENGTRFGVSTAKISGR